MSDDIHSIVACVPHDEAQKIIAFHNAALADERKSFWHDRDKWNELHQHLREQLADAEATIKSQDELIAILSVK